MMKDYIITRDSSDDLEHFGTQTHKSKRFATIPTMYYVPQRTGG